MLGRIARRLPGHYRFTPAKDLADEIEWAKSRRIGPRDYEQAAATASREPPIPVDLFVRAYADYERSKARAGRIDFDDLLTGTIDLLSTNAEAAATIRARKRWFSVDEFQDTSPLQDRLLALWAAESRDVCVVGDADQTIYTFAGASPAYLETFADVHPGSRVVELTENYRSTPEILGLANRLLWSAGRPKRLSATRPAGPAPTITRHATDDAELAWLVGRIRALVADGTPPAEIAVLVRTNAQLEPVESALTRAGVAFRVRGVAFFKRQDVRAAIDVVRRSKDAASATGVALRAAVRAAWTSELGFEDDAGERGAEARERAAAMATLAGILDDLVGASASLGRDDLLAAFARRAADEDAAGAADGGGVELATYHRAKGLEWDAVFLPMLEDGSLPIRQAFDDEEALEEERRLLYVGITRARVHLALSWAERRGGARRPSRFIAGLGDRSGFAVSRPAAAGDPRPKGPRAAGALPEAAVLGDHLALVGEHDAVDVGPHHDRVVGVPHRDRVVVVVEPHQRQRVGRRGPLDAGVEGGRGRRDEGRPVLAQEHPLGRRAAPHAPPLVLAAPRQEVGVQLVEVADLGHRHEEVEPGELDRPLDHPLLVGPLHQAEVVVEQVMALELEEAVGQPPLPRADDPGDHHAAVVVGDPPRHPAEERRSRGRGPPRRSRCTRARTPGRTGRRSAATP